MPVGWKLVPIEPTPKMVEAYRRALNNHIDALPEPQRTAVKNRPHGLRVKAKLKLKLRWEAMVHAAPAPPD
jgi:hypothetical protein